MRDSKGNDPTVTKKKPKKSALLTGDPLAAINADLVFSAMAKLHEGTKPSQAEMRAFKAFEKRRDAESMDRHYAAVPQKLWREWSGRSNQVLREQRERYGIPIGRTIDLRLLAVWLHDFLAKHSKLLKGAQSDAENPEAIVSPALERQREARAKIAELELAEKEKSLVNVELMMPWLDKMASIIRRAGERIERQYGAEPKAILDESINAFRREVEAMKTDINGPQ